MLLQTVALAVFAAGEGVWVWGGGAVLLGLGTAAVYPTVVAQVGDLTGPRDRANTVGIYCLWRDLGYVVGALISGVIADLLGFRAAIIVIAALTAASGLVSGYLLPRGTPVSTGAFRSNLNSQGLKSCWNY